MISTLEHPGQSVSVVLMVLGVVGIYAAILLLWRPASTADRPEWRLWLLLAARGRLAVARGRPAMLRGRPTADRRTVRHRAGGRR